MTCPNKYPCALDLTLQFIRYNHSRPPIPNEAHFPDHLSPSPQYPNCTDVLLISHARDRLSQRIFVLYDTLNLVLN